MYHTVAQCDFNVVCKNQTLFSCAISKALIRGTVVAEVISASVSKCLHMAVPRLYSSNLKPMITSTFIKSVFLVAPGQIFKSRLSNDVVLMVFCCL